MRRLPRRGWRGKIAGGASAVGTELVQRRRGYESNCENGRVCAAQYAAECSGYADAARSVRCVSVYSQQAAHTVCDERSHVIGLRKTFSVLPDTIVLNPAVKESHETEDEFYSHCRNVRGIRIGRGNSMRRERSRPGQCAEI